MNPRKSIKAVLSWIIMVATTVMVTELVYIFLSFFDRPWAYALVVGLIAVIIYKVLEE